MSHANDSTTSAEFFERKYREHADPWHFAASDYELGRYRTIISALGDRSYERAFEPGCSVGELTARLAPCCGYVKAMDISSTAVKRAKQRCCDFPGVEICVGGLPHHIPDGEFDLIVFSELGYYFDEAGLRDLGNLLVNRMTPSATLLAAHWLGTSEDHLLSGDQVHEVLRRLDGLQLEHEKRHAGFRLDRWIRV